jgi:hypothetical protein
MLNIPHEDIVNVDFTLMYIVITDLVNLNC